MAEESPLLCLKWNHFQENLTAQFNFLKSDEDFVDVTFSCEGKLLRAHRAVLSASSPYLTSLFKENPCKHPLIILNEIPLLHLEWLLAFIYTGTVSVAECELPALLHAANLLQIRGLSDQLNQLPSAHIEDGSDCFLKKQRLCVKAEDTISSQLIPSPVKTDVPRRNSKASLPDLRSECSGVKVEEDGCVEMGREPLESLQRIDAEYGLVEPKINESPPVAAIAMQPEWTAASILPSPDESSGETNSVIEQEPEGQTFFSHFTKAQSFSVYVTYTVDKRRHSLDPRPCPICKRHYSNLSNLRQHLRLIHNPRLVQCDLCNKTFKTELYLRRHIIGFHDSTPHAPPNVAETMYTPYGSPNVIQQKMDTAFVSAAPNLIAKVDTSYVSAHLGRVGQKVDAPYVPARTQ